jgi:hypothetical protein
MTFSINDIQHDDTQHNDIQHNDTQHKSHSAYMTLNITAQAPLR